MELSPTEARDALAVVAATEERSRAFRFYRCSSPHLILWGAIWVIGYTIDGLAPIVWIQLSWLALVVAGMIGGTRLQPRDDARSARIYTVTWVSAVLFYVAVIAVMHPTRLIQFEAFPALCLALLYAGFGIVRGSAYLWVGGALFALTLAGYFLLPGTIYPFFMAACGGGGLICSGIWLGRN